MKKAIDLYRTLKLIEDLIRRNEKPDGTCKFDADKVFIFLEAAKNQIENIEQKQ